VTQEQNDDKMVGRLGTASFDISASARWGEAFMHGDLRFKSLSYYQQIEDGAIRGDTNEGSVSMQPEAGLIIHNQTQRCTQIIPAGAVRASTKSDEIFILCASNCMKDELRARFEAECCVEIRSVAAFCSRVRAELPVGATLIPRAVTYYSMKEEMGIRWAFPDKITSEKIECYSWQDEYRFAFSVTGALDFGKTSQQLQIPAPGTTDLPKPLIIPEPREYDMVTRSLRDICRLHIF
jgi:hypothetical protein